MMPHADLILQLQTAWSILILYETIISPSDIDWLYAFAYEPWISILNSVERSSTRIKTPFDGLLLRQYIKSAVMVVWMQSATEQQNFICSTNLEGITPSCQIRLDAPRLGDLHFLDIYYVLVENAIDTKSRWYRGPSATLAGLFRETGHEVVLWRGLTAATLE